ncbi:MAG: hypothetical protein GF308_17945 [Candidatus Heimdallarchaeota archaeon]|nr:hypothetical protein [Candidatus Heimdallarchaeota archaeon]
MKTNKILVLLLVAIFALPMASAIGQVSTDDLYAADGFDSSVGVQAGHTIKYTIDELTLPEITTGTGTPEFTIPDLSGNKFYIKVLQVEENADLDFMSTTGTLIHYAMGLIFTEDVSLTIGEGYTAINMVIPAGAATPAMYGAGVPHFNTTAIMYETSYFFLNDAWGEHETFLTFAGFTVTNGADELSATMSAGDGVAEFTWRKSDGLLTHLRIHDINMMGTDFTDVTIEISLNTDEVDLVGLNISVGQDIILNADTASMDISGSGDIYSQMESDVTSAESDFESMQGNDVVKYHIDEIYGLFYTATVYGYDMETQSLVQIGQMQFCGFLGLLGGPYYYYPKNAFMPMQTETLLTSASPAITGDWDIYTGYMVLADTIVGAYLDDFITLVTTSFTDGGITINSIGGTFELTTQSGYYFMESEVNVDVDLTITDFGEMEPQQTMTMDVSVVADLTSWVAYSDSGILSGMRTQVGLDLEVTTSYGRPATTTPEIPTGTVNMDMDMKLLNPNENPPDPIAGAGGVIPGFTWLTAIPALIGVAAIVAIFRKRKA